MAGSPGVLVQGGVSSGGQALPAGASGLTPTRLRLGDGTRPGTTANPVAETRPPQKTGSDQEPSSSLVRSPRFTKHEKLRLAHVFRNGDVALGVTASRGPMSRQQKDARTNRHAVWVVLVVELFNCDREFGIPDECADGGIDLNLHPHDRSGELLRAKWAEGCAAWLHCFLSSRTLECCCAAWSDRRPGDSVSALGQRVRMHLCVWLSVRAERMCVHLRGKAERGSLRRDLCDGLLNAGPP